MFKITEADNLGEGGVGGGGRSHPPPPSKNASVVTQEVRSKYNGFLTSFLTTKYF